MMLDCTRLGRANEVPHEAEDGQPARPLDRVGAWR
jgi:hypothetical protein